MRILHVSTFLQGGAGRIIAALAVAQRRAGHDVTVVVDAGGQTGYESYPEYITQLVGAGVGFHAITSTFTRDVALNVRAVQELRSLVGPQVIDVAHTHAAIPTLVARLALSRRSYVPLAQTMHGWGIRKTPEQAATDSTLLGLADAVVTPSVAARETLRRLGLDETSVHVIPYGLEKAPSSSTPDASDAVLFAQLRAPGTSIALCIGTIGDRKNQALLVRALSSLNGVAAVFIGDGDAEPLRTLAAELGVSAQVHILGYRTDASRYLTLADFLVLPSMNEGLPIAVLEAFRSGVPVVRERHSRDRRGRRRGAHRVHVRPRRYRWAGGRDQERPDYGAACRHARSRAGRVRRALRCRSNDRGVRPALLAVAARGVRVRVNPPALPPQ